MFVDSSALLNNGFAFTPQAFLAAAGSFDEGAFGITTNDDVQKELGVEDDSIVLLKHFDDKRADFKGVWAMCGCLCYKSYIFGNERVC